MKKLNGREMKALLVLSIVVPVSLLTTFRLIGLLPEPPELESFTVEPVEWKVDRPSKTIEIRDRVHNSLDSEQVSAIIDVHLDQYTENFSAYGGSDFINTMVTGRVNVSDGFVESVRVVFREDYEYSEVRMQNPSLDPRDYSLENLSVADWASSGWTNRLSKLENNTKAFVTFVGVNKPGSVYLDFPAKWVLRSESNQNHELEVALESVYRDENSYVKVVLPILLVIVPDAGETFETARSITAGEYKASLDTIDIIDVYSIALREGQTVSVTVTLPRDANYDLHLYDPDKAEVANSTETGNVPEAVTYTANATGTHYIKVNLTFWPGHLNDGIYQLRIDVNS